MTTVIGVSFKRAGKMYYFDPNGLELHIGDKAIVETARGMECGDVVTEVKEVEDDEVVQPLKTVIRAATEEDLKKIALNTRKEAEAFAIGQARRNQPSVSSRRKSRWALTPASLIIVARSRLSGVTRSDLTFRRSFAHPLTRQRKRIRNRCWQLLFCRFLRGPRRLDLQPWLPLRCLTSHKQSE